MSSDPLWVVGDVQGYLQQFQRVLWDAGLLDAEGVWSGGGATLAVVGDLVDRGPDGIGVMELLMCLQRQALGVGGRVEVLIGNHDILLLAACRFGSERSAVTGRTFLAEWQLAGGVSSDLARLTVAHVEWIQDLPALWLDGGVLMMHADAMLYLKYGSTVDAVNGRFREIVSGDNVAALDLLLDEFSEHRAFLGPAGCTRLEGVFRTYGGHMLVHGHTPVPRVTGAPPESVTVPYVYCDGRCVNVDPGLYLGGLGFAYRVDKQV